MASVGTAPFYGREQELQRLQELATKKTASLVVIKGRRRIGKSRLAAEFARRLPGYSALIFQGLPPTAHLTAEQEREDFAQQINRQLGIPSPRADDWNTLLWSLADRTRAGRQLIVLDEINWLGSKDPTFLGKLKNAWDAELSKNPRLILILSGSLSGWIERNILHHTGFLGRVSLDFTLQELPLAACNLFWGKHRNRMTSHEKLRLLSVTGGVPRYLEEMNPALSADVNIQRMCFTPEGLLFKEFDLIFHDLFSRRDHVYRDIVAALVNGSLDLEALYAALGVGKSGTISEYSSDLVQAGFLSRDYTWDLKTGDEGKLSKLRLSDNYLRFYLKYVQPNRRRIERGTLSRLPNIDGILGLQFENIVLKNRLVIFDRLHIDPNDVLYDNPFFQRKTLRQAGCQIDYLIQIRQQTLYVCEIKFSKNAVPTTVIADVQEKIARLNMPRHTSYRPVLIHSGAITDGIAEQDYFSSVIDFGELLTSVTG
jgi:AAA+ ATPase superfamily predicted ATPase